MNKLRFYTDCSLNGTGLFACRYTESVAFRKDRTTDVWVRENVARGNDLT